MLYHRGTDLSEDTNPITTGGQNRRTFLGASAVALASATLTARADAQSIPSATQGEHDQSARDLGPQNIPLTREQPDMFMPPPTDHGGPPSFWHSFSAVHRRVSEGGWARQVNVDDFPVSTEIAGVNMKLNAGAFRELHWHAADEWSLMLKGNCRLTAIDYTGHTYVQDVKEGDLWYFPAGIPHSLQGLGPEGCEFLLVFDDGKFSEDNTTLITDWLRQTPREVVAKNFGVPMSAVQVLDKLPEGGKYIFQAALPPSLEEDRRSAMRNKSLSPMVFNFSMLAMTPTKSDASGGSVRIIDSTNFPVSRNIAAAYVVVKPGAMRELHWHPNADEWQYYVSGTARMTVFENGSKARTADFSPSDVGYIQRSFPHYIENIGKTDLIYLEMFKTAKYQDVSLNDWITHIPPEVVLQHLEISRETLDSVPRNNYAVVPSR